MFDGYIVHAIIQFMLILLHYYGINFFEKYISSKMYDKQIENMLKFYVRNMAF